MPSATKAAQVMGRGRALEVLLSADDIEGADAERLGYVNRALPDAELDDFLDVGVHVGSWS